MDGTLGSQTGAAAGRLRGRDHEPGATRRDHPSGARAGWPVAVHAIGDLANRDALDAFEETRDEWEPLGLRQRIEHAQLLAPEDIARFGELGVAASVQFSHAPSDRDIADRHWAGKTDGAYAYRSLLESRRVLANGSDAPIEELDPLAGIGPASCARSTSATRGTRSRRSRSSRRSRRRSSPPRGSPATSGGAASSSPATSPTSSSSTATRWRSTPRSYRRSRSSRRCSLDPTSRSSPRARRPRVRLHVEPAPRVRRTTSSALSPSMFSTTVRPR